MRRKGGQGLPEHTSSAKEKNWGGGVGETLPAVIRVRARSSMSNQAPHGVGVRRIFVQPGRVRPRHVPREDAKYNR